MRPTVLKTEFGRVTKIKDKFLVFEAKILLIRSTVPSLSVQLHQECQYDMIESDQKIDGELFKWRVVNVIEIVEELQAKSEELESIKKFIIISSPAFTFPLNAASRVSKHVLIKNKSSESVNLLKCYICPPNSEIIKLFKKRIENGKVLYNLKPKDENGFQLHLQIFPQILGLFEFEIFADFQTSKDEKFTKSYKLKVEICHESNLLTGPKFRNSPRFCDIRFKDYFIPDNIREFDFSKSKVVVENLKKKFPFLDESQMTPQNYIQKLRHAIYLDEIAMEIAFKSYHIPKARFEQSNEYLKLAVKDVAEKRPSIIMGDAVEVSDPFRDEKNQMFYKGFIHKVENDAVLIKFHEDFHENHRNKEYTVNFFFSRSSYKQQNHAIDKVVNELGFDFLFPVKIPSRHLSIYVQLSKDGMLEELFHRRKLQWFDNKLDKYQKQAVVNAMRGECRPMPYM